MKLYPFRALHPPRDRAARVASPPYDVVSTDEARAMATDNADSFLHVVRPEIDLPAGTDLYSGAVYAKAAENLDGLIARGALVADDDAAIWLYRLTMPMPGGPQQQVGFFGCSAVADYSAGRIKRHEFTRKKKEDDRTRHVDTLSAHAGPVFLTCRELPGGGLTALQQQLIASAGAADIDVVGQHDVRHELWRIADPGALDRITAAFAGTDAFYIADGHHRAASAERVRDLRRQRDPNAPADAGFERFATVVFPAPQLKILAYNRVVHDLNGLSPGALLSVIEPYFEIGEPGMPGADQPTERHTFGLYLDGAWRRLTALPSTVHESDPVARLDVAVLQDHILDPLLGIADPRTSDRIAFVGGIRGTAELAARVDARGAGCAFSMFPTSIDELLDVADAGEVMPPKSTWFEPKLASGLLVHRF